MKILSLGWQRSASGYLYAILERILKRNSLYTSYREESGLAHYMLNRDEIADIAEKTVTLQYQDKENQEFTHIKINPELFLKGTSVSYSHLPLGRFKYVKNFWNKLDHVFYIYRDGRDCITSIIQRHTLNEKGSPYNAVDKKIHGLNSFANYGIHDYELSVSSFHIYYLIKQWRLNMLDFIKSKQNDYKIMSINYKDIKKDLKSVLINIYDKLNLKGDINDLMLELENEEKRGGISHVVGSKKFNKYEAYFNKETLKNINNIAGDALSSLGFMKLNEYSEFINNFDTFTLLCLNDKEKEYLNASMLLNNLGKTIEKEILIANINEAETLNSKSKYLVFSNHHNQIKHLMDKNQLIEGINYIYYPYFSISNENNYKIFDIRSNLPINVNDMKKNTIVLSNNSKNSGFLPFDYLNNNGKNLQFVGLRSQNSKKDNDLYSKIKGKNVLIYGIGGKGKELYSEIKENNICSINGFVDSYINSSSQKMYELPIYNVNKMKNIDYDYIVVASCFFLEIETELKSRNIENYLVYKNQLLAPQYSIDEVPKDSNILLVDNRVGLHYEELKYLYENTNGALYSTYPFKIKKD